MKVLLVTGTYLPIKNGGIENYTHQLALLLLQSKIVVEIGGLNAGNSDEYVYDGIKVNNLRGSFERFELLLEKGDFDICHFHEYSAYGGIEIHWLKKAKEYCRKVFFTFHLPYLTCYKNDFRYKGIEDCSNFSSPERCVKCIISTKMNYKKAGYLNLNNIFIRAVTPLIKKTDKINELRDRIGRRKNDLDELMEACDKIFIYANWFKKILNDNGYNSFSIRKIPYVTKRFVKITEPVVISMKMKLLFVGRIEKAKGLHLLAKAMNLLITNSIELDVFGNVVDENYYRECKEACSFNFKGTLPLPELLKLLPQYDFLILPSVFTEMSSMILKDALQNNLPVIASTAKGNVEVINDSKNGFLFEYDNYKDLARVIDKAYELKKAGWLPEFINPVASGKDIEEIVSYYNLSSASSA